MDLTEFLLRLTLITVTVFLVVVGVQHTLFFYELRKFIKKINNLTDGVEKVGLGVFMAFKTIARSIERIGRKKSA
jgi:hypothetical protein